MNIKRKIKSNMLKFFICHYHYHEILKYLERFVVSNSHVMINVYDGLDVFWGNYYFIKQF